MNPHDRSQAFLPVRQTELVPAVGSEVDDLGHDPHPAGRRITLRLVARAVRRHWWQALLLWFVGSVGLVTLAYFKVKPTFLAFARIRVEPGEQRIFSTGGDTSDFAVYKETQVNTIIGPNVLETALTAHPELRDFPKLKQGEDPAAEIRAVLNVGILPKTNLIDVSMLSESSKEAVEIVNAVVEAYLKNSSDNANVETQKKIDRLRDLKETKQNEVSRKREAIKLLQAKIGTTDVNEIKGRNTITVDRYIALNQQLLEVQIDIMKAESRVAMLQNDQVGPTTPDEATIEREIKDLFDNQPRVVEVRAKLERAEERHRQARKNVRDPSDPSLVVQLETMKDARNQLETLWSQMRPRLAAQLRAGGRAGGVDPTIRDAELQLAALKAHEATITDKLNTLTIQQKSEGADAMALQFEQADLNIAHSYLVTIDKAITDIEFENKNPLARIRLDSYAKPSARPSSSNRLKIMAIAPIGMLFGVLSLLVFIELSAGRVVDPDDIPSRIRVPVIGVVPPLPQLRAPTTLFSPRDEFRAQRQLDQFIQSLDHLRVALCSGRNAWGRERRCILITSACGSEGKTTLAAQLAERCVNAGLRTLLIDGDLRNPTLTRMLDVANSKGLINVLRGDATAGEAMSVVGGAGGFHFMPAGTPKVDPSRLLQSEKLSVLLAEARDAFDLVIVDAPPVLPVPDALTIGRWTDGAVLAVRYDMSRFPLVEKANRRLATVGVSVIGAVVNGVRISDATYGSYYPSYDYTDDRPAGMPVDVG